MSDVVCPRNLPWNECGSLGLCDPLTEYCNPSTLTCAPCSQLCPNPDNLCLKLCYCTWIIAAGEGNQSPSIPATSQIEKDYGWKELDSMSKAALITLAFLLIGLMVVIVGLCLFKRKHTKNLRENKKNDSYIEGGKLLNDQELKDGVDEKKTDAGTDRELQQQWPGKCTSAGKPLRRETIGNPCQHMPVQPSSTSGLNEQRDRLPARHTVAALAFQHDSNNNGQSSAVRSASAVRSEGGREHNPGLVTKTTVTSPIQATDFCIPQQINFVNLANATCPDPGSAAGREETIRETIENGITVTKYGLCGLSYHTPDNVSLSLSFPPSPTESLDPGNLDTGYNTTIEVPQMTTKGPYSS